MRRYAPRPHPSLTDSPRMQQRVDPRSIATDSGSATRRVITEHHTSKYKHSSASLRVPQSKERTRGHFQRQVDSAARRTSHCQSQRMCPCSQQRCHQRADPGSQRKESPHPQHLTRAFATRAATCAHIAFRQRRQCTICRQHQVQTCQRVIHPALRRPTHNISSH